MLRPILFLLAATLGLASSVVLAAGLPDTGQDICYNDTAADIVAANNPASIDRDTGTHPRQDCRYGRDPLANAGQWTKLGGGAKGFDYSKIANNGTNLGAAPTAILGGNPADWACTLDNVTGLTWEVKTPGAAKAELRSMNSTYSWYNSNAATNGGDAGTAGGGTCLTAGTCDTEKFVAAVNAMALCGYTDWRMPSKRELETLVYAGKLSPTIDTTYFPNTPASFFWSGSSFANGPTRAWAIDFLGGYSSYDTKLDAHLVQLVRGGQF